MKFVMARSGKHSGRGRPRSLGEALASLADELGIARTLQQYDAITRWAEVVGGQVAAVTVPRRVDNGVLIVSVADAPWRAELAMRRREILGKLQRAFPAAGITDIRFR